MDDDKLKDKILDSDRRAINSKCNEVVDWLDANKHVKV